MSSRYVWLLGGLLLILSTFQIILLTEGATHTQSLAVQIDTSLLRYASVVDLNEKEDQEIHARVVAELQNLLEQAKQLQSESEEKLALYNSRLLTSALHRIYQAHSARVKDMLRRNLSKSLAYPDRQDGTNELFMLYPFKELLKSKLANPNMRDGRGMNALHLAANYRNLNAAQLLLLDDRVELDAKTKNDLLYTSLHIAVVNHDREMAYLLIEHGMLAWVRSSQDAYNRTSLLLAEKLKLWDVLAVMQASLSSSICPWGVDRLMGSAFRTGIPYAQCEQNLYMLSTHVSPIAMLPVVDRRKWSSNRSVRVRSEREKLSGWKMLDFQVEQSLPRLRNCPIDKVDARKISPETFLQNYISLRRPAIITHATDAWTTIWNVFQKHELMTRFGNVDLQVSSIPYGGLFGENHGIASISEFFHYMEESEKDATPYYVFDEHFLPKYLNGSFTTPDLFRRYKHVKQVQQFILGPLGSGAPFHYHCDAMNALIYGRKRWLLFSPTNGVYSKEHPKYFIEENELDSVESFDVSGDHTSPIQCWQESGEIFYVPSFWTHATINSEETIGFAVEFDTGDC